MWVGCAALAMGLTAGTTLADDWRDPEVDRLIHVGMRQADDGDYTAAARTWASLNQLAPAHPAPHVHAVDTLFWLQVHEDDNSSYDEAIQRESEEAVRKAEAWAAAEPLDPRAHFYLGQAKLHLGRLHGVRARLYTAGSVSESGRETLEHALELEPSLDDAKYGLGLYAYYASQLANIFKWIDFLWFVPKGDAEKGLRYLGDAFEKGDLYALTGGFILANVLTYMEPQDHPKALALTRQLHADHPGNSLVHFELVELLVMVGEYEEAIREASVLEAHPGQERHHRGRAQAARVWRARAELMRGNPETAWTILEPFGADGPEAPDWGNRWVKVTRGQILDVQGKRESALVEYEQVASLKLPGNSPRSQEAARAGLETPFELDLPPVLEPRAGGGD